MKPYGFTLTEVLVALTIVGVIAVFAIPKVLETSTASQNRSLFQETLSTLADVMHAGITSGELTGSTVDYDFFKSKLVYSKTCDTNSATQGCWNKGVQGSINWEEDQPGFVLHNGVVLVGFDNPAEANGVVIDINGTDGPNNNTTDQIYLYLCYTGNPCTFGGPMIFNSPNRPGAIGIVDKAGMGANGAALLKDIFSAD